MRYRCWHCRSTEHDTGCCPDRYRGGAVDGPYAEWKYRRVDGKGVQMIEVQIRRPCKRPEPVCGSLGNKRCPDCGGREFWFGQEQRDVKIVHVPVVEWISLAEAMRLAHIEEVDKISTDARP